MGRNGWPLALVALLGCGPEPRPRAEADAGAPAIVTPFDGEALVGSVTRVTTRAEVPIGGHRIDVREGDFMLRHEDSVAVVSGTRGRVMAFGKTGGDNGLVYLQASAFVALERAPSKPSAVEAVGQHVVRIVQQVKTEPLFIESWLHLRGRVLTMASQLVSVGDEAVLVTLGELVAWSNSPTWVEGHGTPLVSGSFTGSFLGGQALGTSYAMCDPEQRLNVRITGPGKPGEYRASRTMGTRILLGPGKRSEYHRVALAYSESSVGDAALALPCAGARDEITVPEAARSHGIEVAHCESERAQRARGDARRGPGDPHVVYEAHRSSIAVPTGCARARLWQSGHAPGAFFDPRRDDGEGWGHEGLLPSAGVLRWRVREKDQPGALPAQIVVRGRGQTPSPNWGEHADEGAARNYLYTGADGSRPIPPGSYDVGVYHGFEHTAAELPIEVKAGEEALVEVELARVVDTTGWISADLHVHAHPSSDAPTLLADRVTTLASVGVEVAVATDHNAVTDYAPTIDALGLGARLTSFVGDEVTTDEHVLGHFNVFPLEPNSDPIPYQRVSASMLFEAARKRSNGGVIQVNHPRMNDLGYFELLHLDPRDVAGWTARAPLADMSFDAIEVFNGFDYDEPENVRRVMADWYALLDAGLVHAATGNSDSHTVPYQDAGAPRNWVRVPTDAPALLDRERFIAAIREARVVVSSGPFIELRAGDLHVGDAVSPGEVELSLRVEAPPWIDVTDVELVQSGEVIKSWKVTDDASPRLSTTHRVTLAPGDWVIALASGQRDLPNLYRRGKPFAFTNPIWASR